MLSILYIMKKYNKIIVFQYGKVGSTSIRCSTNGKYCPKIQKEYKEYIIQTHSKDVTKDILKKYKNILIVNIVRLPINRNISAFYENIKSYCPGYNNTSITELIKLYDTKLSVNQTDKWMEEFFELFNIDIDLFKFDHINKFNKLTYNGNDILLFRFEDFPYLTSNILPKYNIFLKEKINVGSKKFYKNIYNTHKNVYKINDIERNNIINSKFTNLYYSKNEIEQHIKQYE